MLSNVKYIRFHYWVKGLFLVAFIMGASSIPLSLILFGKVLPQSFPLLVLIFPFLNAFKSHLELSDKSILIRNASNKIQIIPFNKVAEITVNGNQVEIRTSFGYKPIKIKFLWIDSRDLSAVITYFKDLQNKLIQKPRATT